MDLQKLKDALVNRIASIEKTQKDEVEKFNADIEYQFTWKMEDIWKRSYTLSLMKELLTSVNNLLGDSERLSKAIAQEAPVTSKSKLIEFYRNKVYTSSTLMDRSTNPLSNLASVWKNECILSFANWLEFPY